VQAPRQPSVQVNGEDPPSRLPHFKNQNGGGETVHDIGRNAIVGFT
jgi:hypothetical protein